MKKGMQSGWLKFQNVMQIQFQIIFMTSGTLGILNLLLTGSTHWTRNGWLTVIWQRHSSSFNQNTSFENLNPNCFKFSLISFCFAFVCKHFSPIGLVPTTAPSTYFTKIQYEPFPRNSNKKNESNLKQIHLFQYFILVLTKGNQMIV